MKHVHSFPLLMTLFVGLLFTSCIQDEEFIDTDTQEVDKLLAVDFAQKLNNPYTIENMTRAVDSIKVKLAAGDYADLDAEFFQNLEVRPTHYYVQFSPADEKQESILKRDSTMVLSDYPLDYEFSDTFFKTRPDLTNRKIPQYYVAVPVDKKIPTEVPHKILKELFIPEELQAFNPKPTPFAKVSALQTQAIKNDELVLGHLLGKAYSISGYSEQLQKKETDEGGTEMPESRYIGPRWTPSGTIMIWDDNIGSTTTTTTTIVGYEERPCEDDDERREPIMCSYPIYETVTTTTPGSHVPLEGAQVLISQLFTVRQGITDANGYFSTGTLRGRARYIIQWERYQYSIRSGTVGQAETRGPKQRSAWNYNIQDGSLSQYYGTIHSAAHDYYYGDRFGLSSPPLNNFLVSPQTKIAAYQSDKASSSIHQRGNWSLGLLSHIHIKEWEKPSERVYGITIHELAHAAHSKLDLESYNDLVWDGWISPCLPSAESCDNLGPTGNRNRRLLETWATTVEIAFALKRYRDEFNQPDYEYEKIDMEDNSGNLQKVKILNENHYTSGGWDMIDDFNQRSYFGSLYPIDRVEGYSITQLENALVGAEYWNAWKDNIKSLYHNETEEYLDELFANWED